MRRGASGLVLVLLVALGLTGCAEAGVDEADAYAIGCPAIDAVLGGGSVVGTAAVAGLQELRDAIDPTTGTQEWIDAAITLLQSADPDDLPADVRGLLVDGCVEHGHQLRNLSA